VLNGLQTIQFHLLYGSVYFEWQDTVTQDKASRTLVTVPIRHTRGSNSTVRLEPKRSYENKVYSTQPRHRTARHNSSDTDLGTDEAIK